MSEVEQQLVVNKNIENSSEAATNQEAVAQVNTEVEHKEPLYAESIFHLGGFTVTNSLLNSWVVVFLIIIASVVIRSKIKRIPGRIQSYLEVIWDGALNLADTVTGDRIKSMKFLKIVFPLFIFITVNNWLGIFPGVGSIGQIVSEEGHKVFVPFFRGGTADLNMTLALALMSVAITHFFGVTMTSAWSHINKFIGINLILEIPKKFFIEKNYTIILVNPVKFFVGLVELVGEVAKVASLSFRLFGNVFAGEVLLASMAAIFAFAVPIPFMFLELIVGLIQGLIFALLTLVFLTIASTSHDHEEAHAGAAHH